MSDAPPTQGTELAVRPTQAEVIRPLNTKDVVAAMQAHQELVRAILDDSDWQGHPDAAGSFVKKSGWRKIAAGYSLSMERVSEEVERDASGVPMRASYTAAAIAPNGRRVEATGHCAYAESRFSGPRGNISKLENDLRATAETRAKNRAVSDLIGMGKVSAEEVAAGTPEAGPPYGPAAGAAVEKLPSAIAYLMTTPDDVVEVGDEQVAALMTALEGRWGYMPDCVAVSVLVVAAAVRDAWGDTPEGHMESEAVPVEGDTPAPAEQAPDSEGASEPEPISDADVVEEPIEDGPGDFDASSVRADVPAPEPSPPADPEQAALDARAADARAATQLTPPDDTPINVDGVNF